MKELAERGWAARHRAPEIMWEMGRRQIRPGSSRTKPRNRGALRAVRRPRQDVCRHKNLHLRAASITPKQTKAINP
jgi:hypothetical protein